MLTLENIAPNNTIFEKTTSTLPKMYHLTDRIGMASGLAFFLVWMYYGAVVPSPPENFDNQILADFYRIHEHCHVKGMVLATFAFLLFSIFVGTLSSLIRRKDKNTTWLSFAIFGSGSMAITIFIIGQACLTATSLMAGRNASAELIRGMDEIAHIITHLFTAPLSIFLITTAVGIWVYRIVPRWLAIPCLLAGFILLITTGSFNHKDLLHSVGVAGLILFLFTSALMSIVLLWQSRKVPVE